MISFKNHNLTEAKNTHMTHIEDLVLDGGVKGARQAINALRSMRDMLSGHTTSPVDVTVKWDGAPAVFAGEDPRDGSFFVAKKGIFNADPKVYKNHDDIKADTSGDLSKKLIMAFDGLKDVGIKGVIQGDFMFDKSDLKGQTINGQKMITFHPNTIVYAVPHGSKLEKTISKADCGIVWHTSYKGATFTEKDNLKVTKLLSEAGKLFQKISSGVLKELEGNKELNLVINVYNNTMVRKGVRIKDEKKHAKGLVKFVADRYAKQIDKRSSQKGKDIQIGKRDELLSFFSDSNLNNLTNVFKLQNLIVDSKLIIINKLNKLSKIGTFVKTTSGFKVTNPEGFVAIDHMEGGAVKLVDRLEFSANNFSKDIIKGWDNPN
jgi:hypothetical protein